MPQATTHLPEAEIAAAELNALYRALGDRIEAEPQAAYWFRRLLESDDPGAADAHVLMAIEMAVLPKPGAYLLDGKPLFTFQQIAATLGFEIGGLYRKVKQLSAAEPGNA